MAKNLLIACCLLFHVLAFGNIQQGDLRTQLRAIYTKEVGVRELTGNNDGIAVERYLRCVGLNKGNPWCAAFVVWCHIQAGINIPHSGYCPNLFTPKYLVWVRTSKKLQGHPLAGDIFGIWFANRRRIAHTGFVDEWGEKYVITVEGNTNDAGSREGDGVYRKRRLTRQLYAVARYIQN